MWQNFKDFWAEPFREDMDAIGWFLWLGLIIVCAALWAIIFRHIKEGIE